MRQKLKTLSTVFLMLFAITTLTACSGTSDSGDKVDASVVSSLEATADGLLKTLNDVTDDDIQGFLENGDDFTVSAMEAWKDNKDELGLYKAIKSSEVVLENELYIVTAKADFEKIAATVTMNVDMEGTPTYLAMEVQYPLGKLMERAALNTVMGIAIVFLMLFLLTVLIGLFKYIGKAGKKPTKIQPEVKAVSQTAEASGEEEQLVDDGELVAVIAAAIAASENTSTDSFTVRSIKRKPNNKWHRA